MSKKEFWTNGDRRVYIYRSTFNSGGVWGKSKSICNVHPVVGGTTGFNTIARAREFLTEHGYTKDTNQNV